MQPSIAVALCQTAIGRHGVSKRISTLVQGELAVRPLIGPTLTLSNLADADATG